ncbi:DUF2605 domain-containing protein [Oxynema aestuarii]|jgi:hypothetical protein|uniref:DUF2605 domain-containing protein n=1 Tax=Oxynema aestuarii AP17 TaxID=2064643 RepID=A0A6H1TZN1_9CYAN|nr:DUF2605 domain-containing protein [Oxynema aestuarii]QIZ71865.1 DUF2605 domain-containing protein [Oxynema aestuarii AP17]RMH77603.1 MAG: DUF2605 domain-containing protein [Cyanobacteria bacterium J007]
MLNPNLPEPDLLKSVLEPLLEDFQYWFGRSRKLLETEKIGFLGDRAQADLLSRVERAQQEVSTAQMLFKATDGKAGVEMEVLMPWHRLLTECWQVAMRFRMENSTRQSADG